MGSKYDYINRFRNYADSNHWKDTEQCRWRKLIKVTSVTTIRGTKESAVAVKKDSQSDFRRPYAMSGDYGDMISALSREALQADYGYEAYSERDKPYESEGDYQEGEYLNPTPLDISPFDLPDIPDITPPDPGEGLPGTATFQPCIMVLNSPFKCCKEQVNNALHPEIFYCALARFLQIPLGINPLTKKKLKPEEKLLREKYYYEREGSHLEEIWGKAVQAKINGKPAKVEYRYGGPFPIYIYPNADKNGIEMWHSGDIIDAFIKGTVGNGKKILTICEEKEKVHCFDEDECEETCCPASTTFEYDDANTADTISPNSSIEVYITGGCSPYTFTTSSNGYDFEGSASYETNSRNATLNCADGEGGVDFDLACNITITDFCGSEVTACIKSTSTDGIFCTHAYYEHGATNPACSSGEDNRVDWYVIGTYCTAAEAEAARDAYTTDYCYTGQAGPGQDCTVWTCDTGACQGNMLFDSRWNRYVGIREITADTQYNTYQFLYPA